MSNENQVQRPGKTERDHKSGAQARNAGHKAERREFTKDHKPCPFPRHLCQGKGNSAKPFKAGQRRNGKVKFPHYYDRLGK